MGGVVDELKTALHAVWMRRWIALAVAWGICLAGWLVVSQLPNRFESRARIFVQVEHACRSVHMPAHEVSGDRLSRAQRRLEIHA